MSQRLESSRPETLISQDFRCNSFSWVFVIPSCSPVLFISAVVQPIRTERIWEL
jgi:hypothetical protein